MEVYVRWGFHVSWHWEMKLFHRCSGIEFIAFVLYCQLHKLLQGRSPIIDDGPRRWHRHARLDPQTPCPIQANVSPHPRLWRQRYVAVERLHFTSHLPLQRLRPGPPLLHGVLHDPTRTIGAISGGVCSPGHGGPWGG